MSRRKRTLFGEPVRYRKFEEYEPDARDGDILLWEPTSIWGRLIAFGTGGPMSHVTAVVRCDGRIYSAGLEEKAGRGGMFPLRAEVRRCPGKISVFRMEGLTDEDRARIVEALRDGLDAAYGWGAIWLSFLWQFGLFKLSMILPHWRQLYDYRCKQNDKAHESVCSQCVHRAFSIAMRRLCFIKKSAPLVTPNDIGQSSESTYLSTLV